MKARPCIIAVALGAALLGQRGEAATCSPGPGLAPLCLTDTVTWDGGTSGTAVVTDPNAPSTPVNSVTPTVSYSLGDQFNPGPIAQDFPSPSVVADKGGVAGTWNFYDDYVFSLTTSSSIETAAISFSNGLVGVGNLEARLVQISPSITTTGSYDSIAASNLGNPPSDGMTVEDGWTTTELGATGFYTVTLDQKNFGSGTYLLQIRGDVADGTGSPSGSYGGSISFTPVPLPAGLPLALSGLGALGCLIRKRSMA